MLSHLHGISAFHPNQNLGEVKSALWSRVLGLVGKEGLLMMLDMLLHYAIYIRCREGNNLRQLSGNPLVVALIANAHNLLGTPLGDLQVLPISNGSICRSHPSALDNSVHAGGISTAMKPRAESSITFVRQRMLYARAALNANGKVALGLRHIRGTAPALRYHCI